MTSPTGDGNKLAALLTRLLGKFSPAPVVPEPPARSDEPMVDLLLYSFLLWESTPAAAARALAGVWESIIDPNELRVALPQEIADWAGTRDGAAVERADRLRAALNSLFQREHRVTLGMLESKPKRETREYLDTLDGMVPFVAARVTLLGFHGHAIPVDRLLVGQLAGEGVFEASLLVGEGERWLERQIRASDAEQIVRVLEAWREAAPPHGGKPKSTPKRTARTRGPSARAKKDA